MAGSSDPTAGVAPHPDVALTVAAVARRLGVAPATLRTWDRRYGLGPSGHTAGTHRRYTSADLARLSAMRRLVLDGVSPAEAARVVLDADESFAGVGSELDWPPAAPVPIRLLPHGEPGGAEGAVDERHAGEQNAGAGADAAPAARRGRPESRAGGGRVIALPSGSRAARGLARAAMALDSAECSRIVRDALRRYGVMATWTDLATPVLVGIGERWEATGQGIEVEHVLSEVLLAALRGVTLGVGTPINSRPVLLACAEEELHSLAMHVAAAALAERHVTTRMLGPRVPALALGDAVQRSGPLAVVVWSQRPPTASIESFTALPAVRPAPFLLAAGEGWAESDLPAGVRWVRDLAELVDRISTAAGAVAP
ncbi:MAG: MerR family transcriptional regulator [Actinomycetes bacterium]